MIVGSQALACDAKNSELDSLLARYNASQAPVEVNFRTLMPIAGEPSTNAHLIHPYPAKLLANIPRFFLATLAAPPNSLLLDSFCGSGTVLHEGALAGLRTAGSDSNPLARLIARAKLTPIEREGARSELAEVMAAFPRLTPDIPDVVNRSYWFSDRISNDLGRLRAAISVCVSPEHRPLFDVSFSATVRRVSYADPRLSVPVKINPERSTRYGAKGNEVIRRLERLRRVDVGSLFWGIANQNIRRVPQIGPGSPKSLPELFLDARSIGLNTSTVDLAITSPPYVGAQKYIRASSLSLGWLGLTPQGKLRPFEQRSIGREHLASTEPMEPTGTGIPAADSLLEQIWDRNPLRARIAQRYLLEMREAIKELARTMKEDAHLVLVVGPNLVTGLEFPTPAFVRSIAEQSGFRTRLHLLDSIDSRGLMTKRNRTAGIIQQESVFLMKRMRCDAQ
jgi:DNA modification methylase